VEVNFTPGVLVRMGSFVLFKMKQYNQIYLNSFKDQNNGISPLFIVQVTILYSLIPLEKLRCSDLSKDLLNSSKIVQKKIKYNKVEKVLP
jgi:hypothetical protein